MDAEIRVVVVDDEPLVRHGLVGVLDSEPGLRVVGEGGDGADALDLVRRERPDVVCLDVRMPGIDGITATERIVRPTSDGSPVSRVLIITTFGADEYVLDALTAGASGFVVKTSSAESIVTAVRTVAAGEHLVFPTAIRELARRHSRPDGRSLPDLTARELEVLSLVAEGLTNAEVAARLVLGVETVRTHVSRILGKLGARDRTQAVVIAYRSGLVPL